MPCLLAFASNLGLQLQHAVAFCHYHDIQRIQAQVQVQAHPKGKRQNQDDLVSRVMEFLGSKPVQIKIPGWLESFFPNPSLNSIIGILNY
jgi:hypothetical protein